MKKGFALAYVMVFSTIILAAVAVFSAQWVANVKINKQLVSSIGSYNIARSGISFGQTKLKETLGNQESSTLGSYEYPTGASCSSSTPMNVVRVYLSDPGNPQTISYGAPLDSSKDAYGYYDVRVCHTLTKRFIESIGGSSDSRSAIKAYYSHPNDLYHATYQTMTTQTDPLTGDIIETTETNECGTDTILYPGLLFCPSDITLENIQYNHVNDTINLSTEAIP